ncbi:MAG: hypothetical protein HY695_35620 [Deltaproteobacteria bacterium]|nr:hypothetical protein [Deltaproteobacteria bacterium]
MDNQITRFRLKSEIPHCRSIFIGVLKGTWKEMGVQYGQRCAKDIARNWDMLWNVDVLGGGLFERLWQQGRGREERVKYFLQYMERYLKELAFLSPELVEFFAGMAEGAGKELDKFSDGGLCSHVLKTAALNFADTAFHPNWDFANDRPAAGGKTPSGRIEGHDCNSLWVRGRATRTGETYAARALQAGHLTPEGAEGFWTRQVAYVALPKDPNARVFWGQGTAGNLGGLGGGLLNDAGVCCLTSGCSYSEENWAKADETTAPGIRDFVLASYGVIFSNSAGEASEKVTVGTERYRKLTGRKTVLRARGANIVFADATEAFCVEQNARHYAVRRPGDLGEKGGDYIVTANHFKCDKGRFDENNVYHSDWPMACYEPENQESTLASYYRFWSGMWMLSNNYGNIDSELIMRDFMASHYSYDREGRRYDPDSSNAPAELVRKQFSGTFCCHMVPFDEKHPLGIGGNANTSVFNLSTGEAWWVPVWPCHYKEWNMDWDYLDLKPFAEYRKMLWGY